MAPVRLVLAREGAREVHLERRDALAREVPLLREVPYPRREDLSCVVLLPRRARLVVFWPRLVVALDARRGIGPNISAASTPVEDASSERRSSRKHEQ